MQLYYSIQKLCNYAKNSAGKSQVLVIIYQVIA